MLVNPAYLLANAGQGLALKALIVVGMALLTMLIQYDASVSSPTERQSLDQLRSAVH
jgi:hypothetical protein